MSDLSIEPLDIEPEEIEAKLPQIFDMILIMPHPEIEDGDVYAPIDISRYKPDTLAEQLENHRIIPEQRQLITELFQAEREAIATDIIGPAHPGRIYRLLRRQTMKSKLLRTFAHKAPVDKLLPFMQTLTRRVSLRDAPQQGYSDWMADVMHRNGFYFQRDRKLELPTGAWIMIPDVIEPIEHQEPALSL